jgi:3-hydroxybutyrate dehydrogenase
MSEATKDASIGARHAVITGASRGIGAATAAAFAADGARVSLLGRDQARLVALAEELGGAARAAAIVCDITQADSITAALVSARRHFGPVEILVNNAGQAQSAPFATTDEELWQRMLAVNLTGAYRCARHALPDMLEQNFGRIVNIASIAGLRGAPYVSAYVASKHGLVGLTRALALELAAKNVTVNAVCPGYTDTDMVRNAVANIVRTTGRSEEQARAVLVATNPQQRLIKPEEVAHAVRWLCRPGTESVNGQCITLAGGEVT